ncbi:MAG: 5-bromo-4-chloroindolyl phosphate hydrolysis family protein [Firmicutes bacterium]|nr:5-bromo-4-chloroindolyl phosphate hydrolysis family protein [Bacillota bacterium]
MDIDKMINVSMDMMDAVTDAVNRGDFSDLNSTLQRMIRPGAQQGSWAEYTEAERRREQEMRQRQAAQRARQAQQAEEARRQAQAQQQARYEQYRQQQQAQQQAPAMGRQFGGAYPYRTPYFQQDVGRYNGLPRVIIGAALIAFSAFGAMFGLGVGLLDHSILEGIISSVPSMLFLIAGIFLILNGNRRRKLTKKYLEYGKVTGDATYITLASLAKLTRKNIDLVKEDIKSLIKSGHLAHAKLDDEETTLMLTPKVYEQYLMSQKGRLQAEAEAEMKKEREEARYASYSPEVREILSEGERYLKTLRESNDSIPGEEMTGKLSKQEEIVNKIFDQVKKDPAAARDLRKFMNYYLPTTEKLLKAYIDVDQQPITGENIRSTKEEIEKAMDTVNEAFENLLDSMFEDANMDVMSDISVMNTMMAQDGLTDKDKMK